MDCEISIGSATSNRIDGYMTPAAVIALIQGGKWAKEVAAVRSAAGDERNRLKKNLSGILWAGRFTTRKNDGIEKYSDLFCADVDGVPDQIGEMHETALHDPHVAAAFVSPSGTGFKIVFRVPVAVDAKQHLRNFKAVRAHVKAIYGAKVDEAAKDVARLCFVSHDPGAFFNADAEPLAVHELKATNQVTTGGADNGERNNSTFKLARLCRDKGQTQDQALAAVREFAAKCNPPLPEAEADACVRSAFNHTPRPADLSEFDYVNSLEKKLPRIKAVGPDWLTYSDGAWQKSNRDIFRPLALEILPPDIRTARRAAALLDHLEGKWQVPPDSFRGFYRFGDSGEILINAANGIVRVTANELPKLLPHSGDHFFTHHTAAAYDPQARADLFRKILVEMLPDELDRDLLQLCCGNFLLPDCRYEVALVCFGEAGGGKSTVAGPVSAALGADLVARLTMSQICDPRSYFLPKLRHAAANLGTELDVIAIDESANFKTLVSGEPVEARPIYGEPFTMQTSCKLWCLANGLPRFKHGTGAELRRVRFIRFDHQKQIASRARWRIQLHARRLATALDLAGNSARGP